MGSLIGGVAPNSAALIAGRAIAGLGVSGLVNGALSILARSVEREKSPLYGVLLAYTEGLRNIFCFLVGMSVISFLMSFGMGWVDVRKKKDVKTVHEDGEVEGEKVEVDKSAV